MSLKATKMFLLATEIISNIKKYKQKIANTIIIDI